MVMKIILSKIEKTLHFSRSGGLFTILEKSSTLVVSILCLILKNGYLNYFELVKTNKRKILHIGKFYTVTRLKIINKPFYIKFSDISFYLSLYLPIKKKGILFLKLDRKFFTHKEALSHKKGGFIIGYIF